MIGDDPPAVGGPSGIPTPRRGEDRGQLLLVAAGVIAIALLPVILAYTQLGYAGIAASEPTATTPDEDALRALERAAFSASTDAQGTRPWADRSAVASRVADRFDARAASIETARIDRGRVHEIERNQSAATAWASGSCPGGPNRQFGPCEAEGGVVVQEREGDVHVVVIAVDVRTVTEDGEYAGTYVLDAERGERTTATQ